MDYIILGTYKTHPEEEGWFINKKYQFLFWNTIKKHFEFESFKVQLIKIGTKENERKIGILNTKNSDRIIFYDLLNYSDELKLANIFSDRKIFSKENFRKKMQDSVDYFIGNFLSEFCSDNVKIGMIGNRSFGLILNKAMEIEFHYKTIKSYESQIKRIGSLESVSIVNNKFGLKTRKFYSLFPITGIFKHEAFKNDNSWNNFYLNKI